MVITVCGVWLLSFFFFSDDKVEPVDCSSQCVFYQGGILTPARPKAKLRVWREGNKVGRCCKVSVGTGLCRNRPLWAGKGSRLLLHNTVYAREGSSSLRLWWCRLRSVSSLP